MKRSIILSLSVLIVSLAGCHWCIDTIFGNIANDSPKRKPGMSDAQYEYALEQHRVDEYVRDVKEWDNEHYMKQYGYPKHLDTYIPPYEDDRTDAEKMFQQ